MDENQIDSFITADSLDTEDPPLGVSEPPIAEK